MVTVPSALERGGKNDNTNDETVLSVSKATGWHFKYIYYLLGSPIDRGLLLFPADPLGRTYAVQKSIKSSGLYRDGVHPFKGFGSDQ